MMMGGDEAIDGGDDRFGGDGSEGREAGADDAEPDFQMALQRGEVNAVQRVRASRRVDGAFDPPGHDSYGPVCAWRFSETRSLMSML